MYKIFKVILLGSLGLLILSACQSTVSPTTDKVTENINEPPLVEFGKNPQLDFINAQEDNLEPQTVYDGIHKFANLWAHSATSTSWYNAGTSYQYNRRIEYLVGTYLNPYSPLETNITRKISTGYYVVLLRNHSAYGGVAHVTAYGSNRYCKDYFWRPWGNNTYVYVLCYDASGNRADSRFNLLFYKNANRLTKHGLAYVLSHRTVSHTPSYFFQYNSRGSYNSVTRIGTGYYEVRFRNMARYAGTTNPEQNKGGTVLVSGYGWGGNSCRTYYWASSGSDILARVLCRRLSNGTLVDSLFTATFMREPSSLSIPRNNDYELKSAYLYNDHPSYTLNWWRTTSGYYQAQHTTASASRVKRYGTGRYQVYIPGLKRSNRTNVQVTAYGNTTNHCNVGYWTGGTTYTYVYVWCYNSSGSLANSRFTLHYQTNDLYN